MNFKNINVMLEIWKDIKDYEGLYQVSNLGRILSLNYRRTGKIRILKGLKDKDGYLNVCLCKNGKTKRAKIHRLVAQTFLPNPLNLPQVNHKDEDKTNNFVGTPENDYKDGNLEWCDCKYNCNYGTSATRIGEKLSKPVFQFTLDGEFIREWKSCYEVQRKLGYRQSYTNACCRGKYKQAYGFIWKYK